MVTISPCSHIISDGGINLYIPRGWKIILITLIFISLFFTIIQKSLVPVFFSLAEAEAVRTANRAINEAVDESSKYLQYDDLIDYEVNKEGNIILMQQNTKYINNFTSKVSLIIQKKLEMIKGKEVSIPLARVVGLDILAGIGPDLRTKVIPVGFVHPPKVLDSFEAAGINQTRHKIYLKVNVKLKLIVPFNTKVIDVNADVPVTEVTILGKVPQVYVGLNGKEIPGIINNE